MPVLNYLEPNPPPSPGVEPAFPSGKRGEPGLGPPQALPRRGGHAKAAAAMVNVSIARRYARALLDVTAESQRTDAVATQLDSLVKAFEKSPELSDVLLNPAYSRAQRAQVVESLIQLAGNLDPILANTLRLLVERNRLIYLPDLARVFREMADTRAGRVRGQVTSAAPLAPDTLEQLRKNLQQLTQRDVILEQKVDPSLLGGVAAQVGSVLYDGSLRTQLEQMRRQLKQQ